MFRALFFIDKGRDNLDSNILKIEGTCIARHANDNIIKRYTSLGAFHSEWVCSSRAIPHQIWRDSSLFLFDVRSSSTLSYFFYLPIRFPTEDKISITTLFYFFILFWGFYKVQWEKTIQRCSTFSLFLFAPPWKIQKGITTLLYLFILV